MSGRSFFDTNVLVYSLDRTDSSKTDIALKLLADAADLRSGVISYQVVQELINLALTKFRQQMTAAQAEEYVSGLLRRMEIVIWSPELVIRALRLKERYKFSWYDCLILAAALEAQCDLLYTEDLQHGQRIEGLEIVNPFR